MLILIVVRKFMENLSTLTLSICEGGQGELGVTQYKSEGVKLGHLICGQCFIFLNKNHFFLKSKGSGLISSKC